MKITLTRRHLEALRICLEVADPNAEDDDWGGYAQEDNPQTLHRLATEALDILWKPLEKEQGKSITDEAREAVQKMHRLTDKLAIMLPADAIRLFRTFLAQHQAASCLDVETTFKAEDIIFHYIFRLREKPEDFQFMLDTINNAYDAVGCDAPICLAKNGKHPRIKPW